MNVLSREDLEALIANRQEPCVSVFLPTHRGGAEVAQDPIRLKNLLRQAEDRLASNGWKTPEGRKILEPAQKLIPDDAFWRHLLDGLALFMSPGLFRYYRLPVSLEEQVRVGHTFHVKPLLPLLVNDGRFFILALSQHHVRLFQATRDSVNEVRLEGVPRNMDEALGLDEPERQRQAHTAGPQRRGEGTGTAVMHGHGDAGDYQKEKLRRFFLQVDRGLRQVLREERAPLVLAAVDYLMPIYREVSTCARLLDQGIEGNPDGLKPEDLHRRAWAVVEPLFREHQEQARGRYEQLHGTPRVSRQLREVLPAAFEGRVDALFVPINLSVWGRYDQDANTMTVHGTPESGDEDLLDLAAIETIVRRGTVYAVPPADMPPGASVAAILRY